MIQGTTIIVVILHRASFIGADSQLRDINSRPQGRTCKIVQVQNSVAAVAGLLGDSKWQMTDIAQAALAAGGSLDQRVSNFVTRTRLIVEPLLTRMRAEEPELYRREVISLEAKHDNR